jgi:type VI secretion system protein ImpH
MSVPSPLTVLPSPLPEAEAAALKYDKVARLLRDDPWSFEFFQAVLVLEKIKGDSAPVGMFLEPKQEVVRFGVHPSLAFPASEIQELECEGDQPFMLVNFMGLTGPSGVLPQPYTVLIQERGQLRDRSLRDFLDLFHHRWISLFFRAWKKYRFPIRWSDEKTRDRIREYMFALVGMATPHLQGRLAIADESLVYYAGLIGLESRPAVALEQLLNDYFGVRVVVEQFCGAWYSLGPDAVCAFEDNEDSCEQLGLGAVVGDEVWDQQSRVRIRLGPLSLSEYDMFLPGRTGHARLRALTRFYSRDQMDFEVQLVLKRQDVPQCMVGGPEPPIQLGWTTWVKTQPDFPRDPEDTVFLLQ